MVPLPADADGWIAFRISPDAVPVPDPGYEIVG
jgi:hypothetical protein